MYDTIFSKMDLNLWALCHKYCGTSEEPHLDLNSHLDLELLFYLKLIEFNPRRFVHTKYFEEHTRFIN